MVNRFILAKGYNAVAIYPFIFLKSKKLKNDIVLINHERIHLRQQKELLLVFFFLWYGLEFLWLYLKFRNFPTAYRQISFEKEAYKYEKDLDYLKSRPWFNFFKNEKRS